MGGCIFCCGVGRLTVESSDGAIGVRWRGFSLVVAGWVVSGVASSVYRGGRCLLLCAG